MLLLVASAGTSVAVALFVDRSGAPTPEIPADFAELVASEELLLDLANELKSLGRSALNLQIPDHRSRHLFADRIELRGLGHGYPEPHDQIPSLDIETYSWAILQESRQVPKSKLSLWTSVLSQVDYFDHARFYFVRGRFEEGSRGLWLGDVNFEARAWMDGGQWATIKGRQIVRFKQSGADKKETWVIDRWIQQSLTMTTRDRLLFAEVLDEAVPDRKAWHRAHHSIHEAYVLDFALNPDFKLPMKHFSPVSVDRHPGLSVVDLDQDGNDDLYVMKRWGKNLFFHNQGDGTFVERAAELGLDIERYCSSAVFADFDNDGDSDLFVGRTLARSAYLENVGGKFVERSDTHISIDLPGLVSSVAAADYNGDGLLDVYFSTYASDAWQKQWVSFEALRTDPTLEKSIRRDHVQEFKEKTYLAEFLSPDDASTLYERSEDAHVIMARPGPPNVLLVNQGQGRFDLSPGSDTVAVWFNTYQSTWGDVDGDGDPDLYVANDFAPNHFFRNDNGKLVDVTDPVTADIGFGMGAAFGDYDNDGDQDLYVSNMFSKAGRRIAEQIPDLDPRLAAMARGNSLLENLGSENGFRKISGMDPTTVQVEAAGWAWGGQFLDADNDTFLDVYSLCGNYTPPRQIETFVDV